MIPVLAISGKRFYGKDTFAAALTEHARRLGHELPVYAFANESKRMFAAERLAAGDDISLERLLADRDYKEQRRPELTRFTVDAIARDPLVFCRAVADRIAEAGRPALISDLRLRLELEHLRSRFALRVVRLARSDAARIASGWQWKAGVDDHHTETELDDPALWDEVVANEAGEAELSAHAGRVVTALHAASGSPRSDR